MYRGTMQEIMIHLTSNTYNPYLFFQSFKWSVYNDYTCSELANEVLKIEIKIILLELR